VQTLSYDSGEAWFDVGPWRLAFRVFTEENLYTPDPKRCRVCESPEGWDITADRFAWAGGQQSRDGEFVANVRRVQDGISWVVAAAMPARIKTLSALVRGAPRGEAMDARLTWTPLDASGALLAYPAPMKLPVFALRHGPDDCTVLASEDEAVRGKAAAFIPEADGVLIEAHHYLDARAWGCRAASPAWRLTRCSDPGDALRRRMRIMEDRWGLRPWGERRDVPDWARRVCLVLNLHGAHWTGFVFNDYDRQLEILRHVCERIEGGRVLAFLAAWDGRYNYNWPRYEPDKALGGVQGFQRLIEGAHSLGVHVVPQFGATSANRAFLPPALYDCGFRDAYGNPWVKPLDWDMDRMPETYRIMANIGHPGFRRFLVDKVCAVADRFGVDGAFLDINQMWHNDPNYSAVEGHLAFAEEMHARYDDFLVFGEGWYDGIMKAYPLAHQSHTMPQAHAEVFSRYCRMTYHLTHPAPGRGSTGVYEHGFLTPFTPDPDLDVIPAVAFVEDTLARHADEVDRCIEVAKSYGRRTGVIRVGGADAAMP
jgi:hypothetical protein